MLYIYSDQIHSGKTTKLLAWCKGHKNVAGILQPVIDNKRYLLNVRNNVLKCLETKDETDSISIGNFRFSNQVFNWANNLIIDELNKDAEWIILDEIGPLEFQGDGLAPALNNILKSNYTNKKIILVIRLQLVEKFLINYKSEQNLIHEFKFNKE